MRRPTTWVALVLLAACQEPEAPAFPTIESVAVPHAALVSVTTSFIGTGITFPADINNDDVATGNFRTTSGQDHAFRWTAAGGLADIQSAAGITWVISRAGDISNNGHIVGHGYPTFSSGAVAWMWTPANPTLRPLSSRSESYARGVNDAGWAVGYVLVGTKRMAAAWRPDGTELVTSAPSAEFPSVNSAADAYDVNNAGQVVVEPAGLGFAVWSPAADPTGAALRVVKASHFPGSGWTYLQGLGIDETGRVLGLGGRTDGRTYGFVWTPGPGAGTVTQLANPPGTDQVIARSANAAGEIVGDAASYSVSPARTYAVYWRDATAAPEILPNTLGGTQASAAAINDHGRVVGTNTISSPFQMRGVLWDLRGAPPPPADATPPAISATVTGTLGANGWHTSNVSVTWSVSDLESAISSQTGCGASSVATDTHGVTFTCSATSGGGTASQSVTIKRDATSPVVSYTGNAGTYTVDQTLNITCSATDNLSGVAASTCSDISGAAHTFPVGANDYSASATDNAGNIGSGSTSFTVVVSYASLGRLVDRFVGSHGVANSLNTKLGNAAAAATRGNAAAADNLVRAFISEVSAQAGKSISASDAAILIALARAL